MSMHPVIPYAALAGAAGFTITKIPFDKLPIITGALGICFFHGLIGALTIINCSPIANNLYSLTTSVIETVPLGLIASHILKNSKKLKSYAKYGPYVAGIGIMPILAEFVADACQSEQLKDISVLVNGLLAIYCGYMDKQKCVIAFGAAAIINRFGYTYISKHICMPRKQMIPLGFAAFCGLVYMIIVVKC